MTHLEKVARETSAKQANAISITRILLILLLSGATVFGHPRDVLSEEPPHLFPPPSPKPKVFLKPQELPKAANAIFPMFDGDGFFVAIPIKPSQETFSATDVYQNIVGKVLTSIGFNHTGTAPPPPGQPPPPAFPPKRIRIPAHNGFARPSANLARLAKLTCQEFSAQTLVTAHDICEALTGIVPVHPGDNIDRFIKEHIGLTYQQYVDDIQRKELEYFYTQVHRNPALHEKPVPIEHAGVRAARYEGETISSVTGRVINLYQVTNTIKLTKAKALSRAPQALATLKGVCCWQKVAPQPVELLLLEYGATAAGVPALRYVYRLPLLGEFEGIKGVFYIWLDAETGQVLELMPLFQHAGVPAKGQTFNRAPNHNEPVNTNAVDFEVDQASGGNYALKRSTLFTTPIGTVNVPDRSSGQSRPTGDPGGPFADFDQGLHPPNPFPLNQVNTQRELACLNGGNQGFQHIDLMATLTRQLNMALAAGLSAWSNFPVISGNGIGVNFSNGCISRGGWPAFEFGYCSYLTGAVAECPSDSLVTRSFNDHTVVAHEWGHFFTTTQYQTTPRPNNWCNGDTLERIPPMACPMPVGRELFHDFADAWAHAIESTNCYGGWFGRDRAYVAGGAGASQLGTFDSNGRLDCILHHDEADDWPRLAELPTDRFPIHRSPTQRGWYSDMQIAAAALWAVREGIRSKDVATGTNWYFARFVQTLRMTGWLGQGMDATQPAATDWNVYRALVDLEVKILNQWTTSGVASSVHNGAHTANKVTAGFAKAGIFLIPAVCIDKDIHTGITKYCPLKSDPDGAATDMGENGGDAVIDINDDYLNRAGPAPSFLIWTGPTYRFGQTDQWTAFDFDPSGTWPSPCNSQYQVEVADNENFSNQKTSGWKTLHPELGECFASWPYEAADIAQWQTDWNTLKGTMGETKLYYRVRTRMAAGVNELVSTSPGHGLFHLPTTGILPPPYAIVNTTGNPVLGDTVPPTIPTGLSASTVSVTQINLTWLPSTDNVGVARYNVLRDGIVVGGTSLTSFLSSGLSPSTAYIYRVQAVDAAGNVSAPSASVGQTTWPDVTPPSPPTGLTVCAGSASPLIRLTWLPSQDNVGVVRYVVVRDGTEIGKSTTTSFSDNGVTPGTRYTYTVAAIDGAGNASLSGSIIASAVTFPFCPNDVTSPAAPSDLTIR